MQADAARTHIRGMDASVCLDIAGKEKKRKKKKEKRASEWGKKRGKQSEISTRK